MLPTHQVTLYHISNKKPLNCYAPSDRRYQEPPALSLYNILALEYYILTMKCDILTL